MRRIFERLFLLALTLFVGSHALSSLLGLMRFPSMPLWTMLLGGGLLLLMVLGFVFKIRSAEFRSGAEEKVQTETIFK